MNTSRTDYPPILVVDDETNMRISLRTMLMDEGWQVKVAESAEQALEFLAQEKFLMMITDARLGGMSGYDLLAKVKPLWPDLPATMITAYATPKLAVEAIKAGAMDYFAKPFAPEELILVVEKCADRYRLLKENEMLRASVQTKTGINSIVGSSLEITKLRKLIKNSAKSSATVLIVGESGTGKELIARAIHSLSGRNGRAYITVNCAAIPEALLESELFGHEKGAFTGAVKQKLGLVEEAHGGTLFLDEIGDMNFQAQAKLLRFLEDGSFTRLGKTQESRVDVRIIAATNRNFDELIQNRQFREDLYHRLNVIKICPPPLRDRPRDIPLLVAHFLQKLSLEMGRSIPKLDVSAEATLLKYSYPGNVRELRNIIERALIVCSDSTQIQVEHLQIEKQKKSKGRSGLAKRTNSEPQLSLNLDATIFALAKRALRQTNGNVSAAAKSMGINRSKLNRILARPGFDSRADDV